MGMILPNKFSLQRTVLKTDCAVEEEDSNTFTKKDCKECKTLTFPGMPSGDSRRYVTLRYVRDHYLRPLFFYFYQVPENIRVDIELSYIAQHLKIVRAIGGHYPTCTRRKVWVLLDSQGIKPRGNLECCEQQENGGSCEEE